MSFAKLLLCHFLLNPFELVIYFLTKCLTYFFLFFLHSSCHCPFLSILFYILKNVLFPLFCFQFCLYFYNGFLFFLNFTSFQISAGLCFKFLFTTFPMNSYVSAWLCVCVCVSFTMFLKIHGQVLSHVCFVSAAWQIGVGNGHPP